MMGTTDAEGANGPGAARRIDPGLPRFRAPGKPNAGRGGALRTSLWAFWRAATGATLTLPKAPAPASALRGSEARKLDREERAPAIPGSGKSSYNTSRSGRSRGIRRDPLPHSLRFVRHGLRLFRFCALRLLRDLVVILGRLSKCYSFFLPSCLLFVVLVGLGCWGLCGVLWEDKERRLFTHLRRRGILGRISVAAGFDYLRRGRRYL
jgi:hypothetical protein